MEGFYPSIVSCSTPVWQHSALIMLLYSLIQVFHFICHLAGHHSFPKTSISLKDLHLLHPFHTADALYIVQNIYDKFIDGHAPMHNINVNTIVSFTYISK